MMTSLLDFLGVWGRGDLGQFEGLFLLSDAEVGVDMNIQPLDRAELCFPMLISVRSKTYALGLSSSVNTGVCSGSLVTWTSPSKLESTICARMCAYYLVYVWVALG